MTTLHTERPTAEEVVHAADVLRDVIVPTPLVPMHVGGRSTDVMLKLESLQPTGSFKIRGVFHAVSCLDEAQRSRGISTVSAGNTAQALAWCGRHFGVAARSVMPEHAPQTKIDKVRALGGQPVLVPTKEVFRYLREHGWETEPYSFIHPWTNRDVMIGHGTMGLEIVRDLPDVETVYVPVGGGGLIAGVGGAIKAIKSTVRVIGVEPEGCPSLRESIRLGRPATVECNTICDGVAVPYITDEMYPLLRDIVDEVVLVSEADVRAMVRRLAMDSKIVAEPSGALAPAAALAVPRDRGISVAIVTGGSIDASMLAEILQSDPDGGH